MTWKPRTQGHWCWSGGGPGSRAGWRVLVPGYPQWRWRQHGRGLVLFGSYVSALAVAVFAWGTLGSLALLAFAVGTHVTSAADVVRQAAFPGFGRWVPWLSATFGIGLGCYGPVLAIAGATAWPLMLASNNEGYVVHRWIYQQDRPRPGHWVWLATSSQDSGATGNLARSEMEPRIAQVLATSGQVVEWSKGERLQVGKEIWPVGRSILDDRCQRQKFQVPDGYLLILCKPPVDEDADEALLPIGPRLVPESIVLGRAWAQLYPVWKRRLLP